tara:strand:+ start:591 stop:842 length:252 start_codon:yes stop_codon:yes gene_type:complete
MKATFENLQKLESTIRNAYNNSNSFNYWETQRGSQLMNRWDEMMIELRGFGIGHDYSNMKQCWIEYCEENKMCKNYDFGDMIC